METKNPLKGDGKEWASSNPPWAKKKIKGDFDGEDQQSSKGEHPSRRVEQQVVFRHGTVGPSQC